MEKYIIFTYDISGLEQKLKMKFIRRLSGYDSIKKGKVERKPGMLQELNGFKFGINTIIVPYHNEEKTAKIFKEFKVDTKSLVIKL